MALILNRWSTAVAIMALLAVAPGGSSSDSGTAVNPGVPWPATDALGRSLPLQAEVGPPKTNRFVGIFYFLWLGHGYRQGPFDVTKIMAADPDALKKSESPLWGPKHSMHHWGESLFGYYHGADPWVLRRHAALLADAGVDTLIFDTTNAETYPAVYSKLCEVFEQVRRAGGRTPQICFMVNTRAGATARKIYDQLYKPGRHRDLWFHWRGKPLMICDPDEADPEVKAFFTLRKAHWPFEMKNTKNAWHWEATYPQPYGYEDDPAVPEQVNVSVAQNLRASDGRVTNMSDGNGRGRSFHGGRQDTAPGAIHMGYNMHEQWKRAVALDPPFVMVTGWNEWIAGRYENDNGSVKFVDQFDQEFSRDIEPMKGGHGDNYFLQLIANVRRYKGVPAVPAVTGPKTIDIEGGFGQWDDVGPAFTDPPGDADPRDHAGFGQTHYTNRTGRNDIVLAKVARDHQSFYFLVRTRDPLTPRTGADWMRLMIDADRNPATGWGGFDFIVNRTPPDGSTAMLEKYANRTTWTPVVRVPCRVEGRDLHLSVPREALGLPLGRDALDFKWADNTPGAGGATDFYVNGDTAPDGRFKYRFEPVAR